MNGNSVVVITTGGTIAMRDDGAGAVPVLEGEGLLGESANRLPEVALQSEAFANLPSVHLTLTQLWQLRQRVGAHLADEAVRGVVITHGTDTLVETAFLLDLTLASPKPVVVTGAMRTVSEAGYDGHANIQQALRVVADDEARHRGTMVVFTDEIHAARYVTKSQSHSPATFRSPNWGPMGRIFGTEIVWGWTVTRDWVECEQLEPDVHLLMVATGTEPLLLSMLVEQRVAGIVIEGVGANRVPPSWLPWIRRATAQGTAVVVAHGTAGGHASDGYGYAGAARSLVEAGATLARGLDARKARLRLMATLGQAGRG
ncbi:MAG: asparaginase [Anaerolineales bacterium]|nr:asparaginase [Anaerolineales bacterium]MCB9128101.1 asparaginase [Ardenticatenales bacterium]MCB9171814.1 asparaginase [Ardenticatenales bacterium]